MTPIIWSLILTVCAEHTCATQDIQWFETKNECHQIKAIHEELPKDGHWSKIQYRCVVKGGAET